MVKWSNEGFVHAGCIDGCLGAIRKDLGKGNISLQSKGKANSESQLKFAH